MPAYMYPIVIKREAQKVRYNKQIELSNDVFTLAELRKYVTEDESFSIIEKENSHFGSYLLNISGERLETDEEFNNRIEREESYMNEYNKRHNKG